MGFGKIKGDKKHEKHSQQKSQTPSTEDNKKEECKNIEAKAEAHELVPFGDDFFIATRMIIFSSSEQISQETFGEFASRVNYLVYVNRKAPIFIIINNFGGDVYSSLAIYDLLRECPCPIIIKAYGAVMSGASLIMQAGDIRIMSQNCTMMIHGIYRWLQGTSESNYNWVKDDIRVMKTMEKIYTCRMKAKDKKDIIRGLLKVDTVLKANDALKLGLIDKVE